MASLPAAAGFLLVVLSVLHGCCGEDITRYNITPDSCDHCLTLDVFASNNTSESLALFLTTGIHTLTRNIEIVGVDQFSILSDTSVTIQCASPASFLFENINNLEISNTAIVSCGGGGSSNALQVRSVQQFNFTNVTLQESANDSLNVQDSIGLVREARFIGNTGTGMNIANSTVVFEGKNTFSDNLDGGIASYYSTLQFIGVNQFTNNTATRGGGISAISSTINCRGNMTFEFNSAEQGGGGVYARGTRMTSKEHIRFMGNTAIEYFSAGGGLYAGVDSTVDFNAECDFINNSAGLGGVLSAYNTVVNINADSNFMYNSAQYGGGVYAYQATVNISRESNFINNSAQLDGGGVYAWSNATVYLSGTSNFMYNSAQRYGGGVYARSDTTVYLSGTSNFMYNSAQWYGGGVWAWSDTTVYLSGTSNFMYNSAQRYGGGVGSAFNTAVNINADSNFMYNSAVSGGGVYAYQATVNISRENSGTSNFMNNSAQNRGGGIASYYSTLVFSGVNQFTNNTATRGGGISAISSTINCSGNMTFEYNSAEQCGGGVYARGTRMTTESLIRFIGNKQTGYVVYCHISTYLDIDENAPIDIYSGGGGLCALDNSVVNINAESNFIGNSAQLGGGIGSAFNTTVNINAESNFIDNSAEYGGGIMSALNTVVNINADSIFLSNSAQKGGGGLYAVDGATVYLSGTSNFINNSAQQDGGGVFASDGAVNISGTSNFMYNSAQLGGGGVYAWSNTTVYLSGTSNFMNNSAQLGGGVYAEYDTTLYFSETSNFTYNSAQYGGAFFLHQSEVYISDNSSFTMNSASLRGGGMYLHTNSIAYVRDSVFSDNWSMYGGGISILQSGIMLQGTVFSNNSASYGGAIQALDAKINITGNDSFTQNIVEVNGGALALSEGSVVNFFETASLTFAENIANSFGGAIFIEDESVHCSYAWSTSVNGFIGFHGSYEELYCFDLDLPACFTDLKDNINISFSANSAMAGSAIFGGEIDGTVSNLYLIINGVLYSPRIGDLLRYLINVNIDDTNNGSSISSNPNRICGCVNGQPDCSVPDSPYEVSVYPGQTVGVSLVAVGQRNGTVPSTTTAMYDPDNGATFGDLQSTQRIDHTTCTELNYTLFSRRQTETLKIYVDSSCGLEGIPLSVNVTVLECPIGFTLSNSSNQCVCEERLQKYTNSCDISNLEITRTASEDFWVGVDNTNGTEGLILHPHCPFDYCTTDTVNFTLVEFTDAHKISLIHTTNDSNTNNSTVNDTDATDYAVGNSIDAQCNFNRSGLLCGKCQKGFSLVFGSSKCLKCSNSFLSLLIAFALAGIVLVVFLLVLKLTVAVGTINGLIFYANIVSVNREKLFPSGETNILTVFIAWVNLDLGIETCFFDGMDAYSKAWLQYAFPVYVWALVGAIILVSRHSTRIVRSLGNNPVAVLATLFLLSYAKLLRSIINPLFVTFLEYPTDSKAVWLVDGNIPYLNDKHVPLFLTSLLALFLLFIPFTLLLLLGQWIQAQSERKCFKWISDYRVSTFLDVYHGPFKSKHRYWCGLLLVARFCLFLVFAFNVNGDPSVNVLAIVVSSYGVHLMFIWFKVYKTWYLNVLEASFICNLSMLAVGTYYVEISGGNQSALTYTSVSVAFATFCGIVVYHSCLQIKDTMLFKKLYKKLTHYLKSSADDTSAGDIEMKEIEEDPPRKYTKPPTTSVVEITH